MSNYLLIGNRKQGKSTLSMVLANVHNDLVVIFDPNGQFPEVPRVPIAELDQTIQEWSESESDSHLWLRVGPLDTGEISSTFDALAAVLFNWENYSLIVDEANSLQTSNKINPSLDRLLRRSPSSVAIVQNTHRVKDTNTNTRFHSADWWVFLNERAVDLDAIEREWGNEEIVREIRELDAYQCVHIWRGHGGRIEFSTWDKPEEWYFPIGNNNSPDNREVTGKRRRAARVVKEESEESVEAATPTE